MLKRTKVALLITGHRHNQCDNLNENIDMEYHGKLYGKAGGITFNTGKTTEDWDAMEKRIAELEAQNKVLSMSAVVGRSEQLPPNPIIDKEHKDLIKALYPEDKSKRFRR